MERYTDEQVAQIAAEIAYPVFAQQKWTYHGDEGSPTVERLEETILNLLAMSKSGSRWGTGRFEVEHQAHNPNVFVPRRQVSLMIYNDDPFVIKEQFG